MSVRDNIAAGKYENKVPYGIEKVKVDPDTMTITAAKAHVEAEKQRELDQRRKHREEEGRLTALVCADLEEEHGLTGHPKAALLWRIAWEQGHAYGYGEVVSHYETMAELLK